MYSVRMFFEKVGSARYISHLDLMRCFERVMRRASIPMWYTEGFNPRPFLSFAVPLSLGTAGLREAVDFRLLEEMPFDEIKERINVCMPEGLRVLEVTEPVNKITAIEASRYNIKLVPDSIAPSELHSAMASFFRQESIVIKKLNKKKKEVEVDIRPHIKEYLFEHVEDGVMLHITLSSGCNENCNPSLVIDALASHCGDGITSAIEREKLMIAQLADFC
ncbi:MAG: DUF2344 domain-containing protein [Clostridia bacterium]|nr:DUF2344 domain-containing protein [Clostridia bacterium]